MGGDERPQEEILKIIGHPVMIWNILKWADINSNRVQEETHLSRDLEVHRQQIVQIYYYFVRWLDKPIDEQDMECIEYIYNLLPTE